MRILRIIIAAVLFVACVFLATANMHEVRLAFPKLPIQGWPQVGDVYTPLFVVVLGALVVGVLVTGLATLVDQLRLRSAARRARKESVRGASARAAAETARDEAQRDRDIARTELERVKRELIDAQMERDAARSDLDRLRAELQERARAEPEPPVTTPLDRPLGDGEETV